MMEHVAADTTEAGAPVIRTNRSAEPKKASRVVLATAVDRGGFGDYGASNVPLGCLSGRNDRIRALRHGAGTFFNIAKPSSIRSDDGDERRRFRTRLVWRSPGARPLSGNKASLVRRKPPLSMSSCSRARRDRHRGRPSKLPPLRLREVDVHAQRLYR
jgi:hypothetical protein